MQRSAIAKLALAAACALTAGAASAQAPDKIRIGYAISKTIGFRIEEEDEVEGIDFTEHSETGYDFVSRSGGSSVLSGSTPSAPVQSDAEARGVNA